MDIYNKLFDSEKYNTLSDLVRRYLGEDHFVDFLDDMIAIQDRAIDYCKQEKLHPVPFYVYSDNKIFSAYLDFIRPFAQYYSKD